MLLLLRVAAAEVVSVYDGTGAAVGETELRTMDGTVYLSVGELGNVMDGVRFPVEARYRYVAPTGDLTILLRWNDRATTLRLKTGRRRVDLPAGSSMRLSASPRVADGVIWIPLELLQRIPADPIPLSVTYEPDSDRLTLILTAVSPSESASEPTTEDESGVISGAPELEPPETLPYRSTRPRAAEWAALRVMLDPGHGGADLGARGNGLVEKNLTLQLAREIRRIGTLYGGRVFLTRDQDVTLDARQRAAVAEQRRANVFIALHFNESISPDKSGYLLIVHNPQQGTVQPYAMRAGTSATAQEGNLARSRSLAQLVEQALDAAGFEGTRAELPMATLGHVQMPAVHIELAYLSNRTEARYWLQERTRRAAAEAIWAALAQYRP